MMILAITLGFTGFTGLCLSMEKHCAAHFRRLPPTAMRRLHIGGWMSIALSFGVCVYAYHWGLGSVAWFGCLTVSGLLLTLGLRPYQRALIVPMALAGPPLAAIAAWLN